MIALAVLSILTLTRVLPPVWTGDWWQWVGAIVLLEVQLWRVVRALQRRKVTHTIEDEPDRITLHEGKLVRVRMNKPKGKP